MLGNDVGFVRRRGAYTVGSDRRASPGAEETFNAKGALQPLRGDELEVLPEGLSTIDSKKFYQASGKPLRTVDKHKDVPADLIQFEDQYGDIVTFTVVVVEYHGFGLKHTKATLTRTDEHVPASFTLGFGPGFS